MKSKEIDRLAFITEITKGNIGSDTLKSPKYLGNKESDRFFWSDFYDIIRKYAEKKHNEFTAFLLLLFEQGGLKPCSLPKNCKLANKEEKDAFQKLWGPTRIWLNEVYGWHTGKGSGCEVYAEKGNSKGIYALWLDPHILPGRLRVRLTFKDEVLIPEAMEKLKRKLSYPKINISVDKGRKNTRNVKVIDIVYPLAILLDNKNETERKESLKSFVQGVLNCIE